VGAVNPYELELLLAIVDDEVQWKKLVTSSKGVRSLLERTEFCTVEMQQRAYVVARPVDRVPFKDFVLVPFTAKCDLDQPFFMWLMLEAFDDKLGVRSFGNFKMYWRSYRRVPSASKIIFEVDPSRISVAIPRQTTVNVTADPRKRPKSQSAYDQVQPSTNGRLPLRRLSAIVVADARKASRTTPTNGFSKSRGVRPNPETHQREVNDCTFTWQGTSTPSGQRNLTTYYRSFSGTTTPNFGRTKAKQLPFNPYSLTLIKTQDGPSYGNQDGVASGPAAGFWTHNYYGGTEYTFVVPPPVPGFDSALLNRTLSKLEERAGVNIMANFAQDLAQFGQLQRLILGNAETIAKAYAQARNGNVALAIGTLSTGAERGTRRHNPGIKNLDRFARKGTKDAANRWLELQYGWKPLMQDIYGAIRAYAQSIEANPPIRRVSARSRANRDRVEQQGPFVFGGAKFPVEIQELESCKAYLYYSINPTLVTLAQQFGFLNPINLAWEVLPYSFVADWLLPIGPYLESLTAWQGVVFRSGGITKFVRQRVSCSFDDSVANSTYINSVGGRYDREVVVYRREPLAGFPAKELPTFKSPFSPTHVANAFALVGARLGLKSAKY
jgi:hypothetical protein